MREADFEALLHLVERLGDEQRTALGRALASASGEPEAGRLLERAFAAAPRCPHCGAERLQRWGDASGLRRYRCQACRKTFNALTGTALARLRKKACWLRDGEALAAGMTLAKAAAHCGVRLMGNARLRHLLVESAWTYRHPPRVGKAKLPKLERVSPRVREIAWKAQSRLTARYRALTARGKKTTVTCTAIARELAAFMWAVAREARPA